MFFKLALTMTCLRCSVVNMIDTSIDLTAMIVDSPPPPHDNAITCNSRLHLYFLASEIREMSNDVTCFQENSRSLVPFHEKKASMNYAFKTKYKLQSNCAISGSIAISRTWATKGPIGQRTEHQVHFQQSTLYAFVLFLMYS